MDYTVHGILWARILEWVAFPFSRGSSQSRDRTQVSHIAGRFFTTWATREAQNESLPVLSISLRPHELYRPWSSPGQTTGVGNFFPFPTDLPNPGIELGSPALQVDSLPTELSGKPPETLRVLCYHSCLLLPFSYKVICIYLSIECLLSFILSWLFCQHKSKITLFTCMLLNLFSPVLLFAILCIVTYQGPLSMRFPRQEYWSGLPCPPPEDLPNPEIKHMSLYISYIVSSVQLLSCVRLSATPWTATRPVQYQLSEPTQTHVLWVRDDIQPSHPLSSPSPALSLSQHQGLFHWVSSSHPVAKVLECQLQHQSFQWWTGWISLQSKGLSRVFSNTTIQKHQFFGAQLSSQSNSHIHTWPLEKP